MGRLQTLTRFINAVHDVTLSSALGIEAKRAAERIFLALEQPGDDGAEPEPETLDACRHLGGALDCARGGTSSIAGVADAFEALAPSLTWKRVVDAKDDCSNFHNGHANTRIVGPDAFERRSDVIIGATLMAPGINYPEHHHRPEEFYIVMSEGEWYQQGNGWHSPGIGGIVYNPSDITHAMRSADTPLFAIWCLWVERP